MKTPQLTRRAWPVLAIMALALFAVAAYFGHVYLLGLQPHEAGAMMLAEGGVMDLNQIMKALDALEGKLKGYDDRATAELKSMGKVGTDTKSAIDNLGIQQRELADRLTTMEQKGQLPKDDGKPAAESWGAQFVKSANIGDLMNGNTKSASYTVKNTVTNTVGNTFDQLQPGIVGGSFRRFRLEDLLVRMPCNSDAVQYVRENVFTNTAAETTEANALPESSVTTSLVTEPVATIGHWLKISRQLAADNKALAVYIDLRLRYGVDLRVENQIFAGNGVAPNMSGMTKAGNFTAHGYTAAALTALGLDANKRFDLIGKIIGDMEANDYYADVIMLNPADWWTMRLTKDAQGRYILGDPGSMVPPSLFGRPVVSSNAVTPDNVGVADIRQAGTFYDRETVEVAMSEHDGDNFQKLLITLRAHRRCMLAMERPAAFRYGDLTPA